MILGRSKVLWIALVGAALNAAVVVFGVPISTEGIAALNALGVALIGIFANEHDPTTAGTFALTVTPPPSPTTTPDPTTPTDTPTTSAITSSASGTGS